METAREKREERAAQNRERRNREITKASPPPPFHAPKESKDQARRKKWETSRLLIKEKK